MRHVISIVVTLGLLYGVGFAEDKPEVKDEKDRINYSVGYQIGRDFKRQGVEINPEIFVKGIRDAVSESDPMMTMQEMDRTLAELKKKFMAAQQERQRKMVENNLSDGKAFLEENGKKEGVTTLPSGLQYRVIKEGSGAAPKMTDTVTVNYRGTMIDGSEFDSTYSRGRPSTFQLSKVIRGWSEGLVLMKPGAKFQLFIPPELAYGERGAGHRVGPNSTLIFEVELISVKVAE